MKKWLTMLVLLWLSFTLAQSADELLTEAREVAAQAQVVYEGLVVTIDRPLWSKAIGLGEQALQLEPNSTEALRFLASAYSHVNFYIRAWNYWQRFVDAGGELDEEAQTQLAEVGMHLGYARYRAGDLATALQYYGRIYELVPTNSEALIWVVRSYFELGRVEDAQPYLEALVTLAPNNTFAQHYIELREQRRRVGAEASDAFQRGLSAYELGDVTGALAAFEVAIAANNDFVEAFVWAGRTSLELGQPEKAERYWRRVQELEPSDDRASYFVRLAEDQQTWGVEAAQAYHTGLNQYQSGELAAAAASFARAFELNPRFKEAAVWAARSFQEHGDSQQAIDYWQAVLVLEPADSRAAYFLDLAREQARYGGDAAGAFLRGLETYQLGHLTEAENYFLQATEQSPNYADAWAWLGRINFELAEFKQAADYYGRALELAPNNDDYRFFAQEAARLAE